MTEVDPDAVRTRRGERRFYLERQRPSLTEHVCRKGTTVETVFGYLFAALPERRLTSINTIKIRPSSQRGFCPGLDFVQGIKFCLNMMHNHIK